MNVKFQEGVGRHDKFRKTIVKFPSATVYVYVVVRKVPGIYMSFLNIIIAVKFGRKLVLVYRVPLNTKKVVEFFFSTHFCCQRYFCKITY